MPQLNPEFFLSQIFWFIVTFSFLFVFLWKVSLPRISSVIEKRKKKIEDDIGIAKKLQTEAEEIQANIDKGLIDAREEVSTLVKETTNNLQKIASNHLKKIDEELSKKIDESSNEIKKNKEDSLKNINKQIQDITKLTISKLTDISINTEEINEAMNLIQNKKSI